MNGHQLMLIPLFLLTIKTCKIVATDKAVSMSYSAIIDFAQDESRKIQLASFLYKMARVTYLKKGTPTFEKNETYVLASLPIFLDKSIDFYGEFKVEYGYFSNYLKVMRNFSFISFGKVNLYHKEVNMLINQITISTTRKEIILIRKLSENRKYLIVKKCNLKFNFSVVGFFESSLKSIGNFGPFHIAGYYPVRNEANRLLGCSVMWVIILFV